MLISVMELTACTGAVSSTSEIKKKHFGRSRLIEAVIQEDERRVSDLLSIESKFINQADFFGMTALHYAAASGNERIFRQLLFRGANAKLKDHNDETVLHKFARVRVMAPIEYLKTQGLRIDESNKQGETPLQIAASIWNTQQIERFLANGANPNIQNVSGQTALHIVIKRFPTHDSLNVIQLKADLARERDTTKIGYWLLTKRKFKNSWKTIKLFFADFPDQFKPKPKPLLRDADGLKSVELLLNAQIKTHLRDKNRQTALAIAQKKAHYPLTKFLIQRGLFNESDF
jgi:ankyrin repeat protein